MDRHKAGSLDGFEERPKGTAHVSRSMKRGVCPTCSRPLQCAAFDARQALARCSCGFSAPAMPGSKLYRSFKNLATNGGAQ